MASQAQVRQERDKKAFPHLQQYAPVWIVEEKFFESEESIQFDVVFQHSLYGWVIRRYRYDGFNGVLYHKGQTSLSENDALELMQADPYLETPIADIPNAYGG